jgi:hypothetical protein
MQEQEGEIRASDAVWGTSTATGAAAKAEPL